MIDVRPRSQDIAGEQYWSETWESRFDRSPVDERDNGWRNYVTRRFDELFCIHIPRARDGGIALLEVGCARSRWLPYFSRRFKANVAGLDYSELGCRQAEEILRASGTAGDIHLGDLFSPPAALTACADVVFSWGLVEHFRETRAVAEGLHRLSKPGGIVITVVPNMVASVGWLQKFFDEKTYLLHVPLDREALRDAFDSPRSEPVFCDYFLPCNYWVVHRGGKPAARFARWIHAVLYKMLAGLSLLTWRFEEVSGLRLPATRFFAPYVVCISRTK